jgi:class 3 adenylate cyclase
VRLLPTKGGEADEVRNPYDPPMPELPTGTVTFVFTDIEGSTGLLKHLGEHYRELLAEHRRIVRELFTRADGIEIDTQGDAFFFVFPRARDAVTAAVEVQRAHVDHEWPESSVVRVRIGLHTGEPALGEEGYLGLDVVRAARICTAGRGGGVLLSETTRALLGSTLPEGVSVFPLGERHLKGIDEPERVYELAIEGLEAGETEALAPTREHASEDWERGIERRVEDLGTGLAERIQERVFRSIEGALGKGDLDRTEPGPDDSDVEDLAARAASLEERIGARVEAALKAKGLTKRDES